MMVPILDPRDGDVEDDASSTKRRSLLQLAESSFWSLSALAVQPAYLLFREGFRHLVETLLAGRVGPSGHAKARASAAAASGLTICCLALGVTAVAWPATNGHF